MGKNDRNDWGETAPEEREGEDGQRSQHRKEQDISASEGREES